LPKLVLGNSGRRQQEEGSYKQKNCGQVIPHVIQDFLNCFKLPVKNPDEYFTTTLPQRIDEPNGKSLYCWVHLSVGKVSLL
jgi:hypothetical protein